MRITQTEITIFVVRTRFYNEVLGVLCFGLALAAIGTEAPCFYALLSMAIVLVIMLVHGRRYSRIYALWREVDHPLAKAKLIWKKFMIFNAGWGLLSLVACGLLTKHGILGFA